MINLENVLVYLKDNNLELVNRIDSDNFYFEINTIIVSLTTPHSGNGYTYLLRADFKEDFDRWSNCSFETNFKSEEEMIKSMNELFDNFS